MDAQHSSDVDRSAAAVLAAVREHAGLSRTQLAGRTGLSIPTVSRRVNSLLQHRLLRELPAAANGSPGRPGTQLELDTTQVATCGLHVGAVTSSCGLVDLRGQLLGSCSWPTPAEPGEVVLERAATSVRALLDRNPGPRPAGLGVTSERHLADPDIARAVLQPATGLRVLSRTPVAAAAATELLLGPRSSSALFLHADDTVDTALAVRGRLHRGPEGSGRLTHLPVGGAHRCASCGTGCVQANATTGALLAVAQGSDPAARGLDELRAGSAHLLSERARLLGRAAALLRDVCDPHAVVLSGPAVAGRDEFAALLEGFGAASALPGRNLVRAACPAAADPTVAAACAVLAEVHDRPLSTTTGEIPAEVS